ncbi:MAG: M20/M25/M40 family metallo-hydrolase [Anaerolineae bacterium]|nr:M20/M25/M40 family metallo-hydrolase [Gemmatimonadaceae bacterium]
MNKILKPGVALSTLVSILFVTASAQVAAPPARSEAALQASITSAADTPAIRAIMDEGIKQSRVPADLQYLTDVIGPRLTGSVAMRRANDWTARKFREYGMDSTWLEPWKFGQSWERGPLTLTLLAPHKRQLYAESWAWSPGTKGPLAGNVVYVDAKTIAELKQRFGGKLKGRWVLVAAPVPVWNPDGPPMTQRDSVARDSVRRVLFAPAANADEQRYRLERRDLLAAEGIAGIILSGSKEFALMTMSGSPSSISPVPQIVVSQETYSQFHRLLALGEIVRIEARITNTMGRDSLLQWNTVAEIRGSEKPDEVVLLGAHLDSWDLGTGTTDNATGSIAVLEAARILKAAGVKPKRTIRFVLFSGEEQGLYGSAKYAEAHEKELNRFQAVAVLDNGTGRIKGMALQGRDELGELWKSLFAAVEELGPFAVRSGNKGGTDHLPFLRYGVPAFNYDQESRGYGHTHHSQADTYDHAVLEDVKQAATVMAATAYQLANLPELLPRNAKKTANRESGIGNRESKEMIGAGGSGPDFKEK